MKTFLEFLQEEMGGGDGGGDGGEAVANTTANVQGLRTEPLVRNRRLAKLLRRTKMTKLRLDNIVNRAIHQ